MMIINMNTTVHKIKFYINWEKIDQLSYKKILFCEKMQLEDKLFVSVGAKDSM